MEAVLCYILEEVFHAPSDPAPSHKGRPRLLVGPRGAQANHEVPHVRSLAWGTRRRQPNPTARNAATLPNWWIAPGPRPWRPFHSRRSLNRCMEATTDPTQELVPASVASRGRHSQKRKQTFGEPWPDERNNGCASCPSEARPQVHEDVQVQLCLPACCGGKLPGRALLTCALVFAPDTVPHARNRTAPPLAATPKAVSARGKARQQQVRTWATCSRANS